MICWFLIDLFGFYWCFFVYLDPNLADRLFVYLPSLVFFKKLPCACLIIGKMYQEFWVFILVFKLRERVFISTDIPNFPINERQGTRKEREEEEELPWEEKAISTVHLMVQKPVEWGNKSWERKKKKKRFSDIFLECFVELYLGF